VPIRKVEMRLQSLPIASVSLMLIQVQESNLQETQLNNTTEDSGRKAGVVIDSIATPRNVEGGKNIWGGPHFV
jgi:hypothetical protein